MEIEIIKFGGMAMKTKSSRERIAEIVKKSKAEKKLIVVSAMGRAGFPYATDTLKELINDEITKKEMDRLLSLGEIVASVVLSNDFNNLGLKAYSLSLKEIGFTSDLNYGAAYIKELNNEYILSLFEKYDVLICPGFVALNEDNEPTTLGRGGSDLTAILLATVLSINEVTLYKDVDGVYPCKPPLDQRIAYYKNISYSEQLTLSEIGLNIVQSEAIKEAEKMNIKIKIKNFHTLKDGTIISKEITNSQIIGLNTLNNELLVATFEPEQTREDIIKLLNNNHIYVKEEKVEENKIRLKISLSQVFLARRLILMKYFINHQ